MTEKLKRFLEAVSANEELAKKASAASKEELIAMAEELGIELTEDDLKQESKELSDDELDAVAGGAECGCFLGGGGKGGGEWDAKTCVCVTGGGGQTGDSKCRCACTVAGWGAA